jgi:hypothetical protein
MTAKKLVVLAASLTLLILPAQAAGVNLPSGPAPSRAVSGGVGLGTSEAGTLACESSEGTEEIAGATTATLTVTLRGCIDGVTGYPCGNIGEGEIQLALVSETSWTNQAQGLVGEDYRSAPNEPWMQFSCYTGDPETTPIVVTGGAVGTVQVINAMTEEQRVVLSAGENHLNIPSSLEGLPESTLKAYAWWLLGGQPFDAALELTWTMHTLNVKTEHPIGALIAGRRLVKDPIELRAISGQRPEHGRCQKTRGGQYANAACTVIASTSKKGRYAWRPI